MSIWDDERADTILRDNWGAINAAQIADLLNAAVLGKVVNRNAVIGRAKRIGLERLNRHGHSMSDREARPLIPRKATAPKRPESFRRNAGAPRAPTPAPEPVFTDAPPEQRLTLMQLEDDTCRFPIGDPREEDAVFCPCKKIKGSSYCRGHFERTTNPYYR